MESTFYKLLLTLTSPDASNDTLHQIKLVLKEQQQGSALSTFLSDSFSSLLTLQHWAWQLFAQLPHQYLHQPYHAQLLHTLASFNKTLVFHYDQIDLHSKVALLVPQNNEQIDRIFTLIDQCVDDNDPLISMISLWLENHAYFLHDNPAYDQSPVIHHIGQVIATRYVMSEQYKIYLSQLRQTPVAESVLSARMLFYVKTCSFYVYSNLGVQFDRYPYSAEEMLRMVCDGYLEIMHVHSCTVSSWNPKLLGCIVHLASLILECCCWTVNKQMMLQMLLPSEKIACQHVEDLIRIVAHTPFYGKIHEEESNDETILLGSLLTALIVIIKTHHINWFLRANRPAQNVLLTVAHNSVNDKICLRAYTILGIVLTNEQLKDLSIADGMAKFFFNMLELGWKHPSKSYKRIPIVFLLRSKSQEQPLYALTIKS